MSILEKNSMVFCVEKTGQTHTIIESQNHDKIEH